MYSSSNIISKAIKYYRRNNVKSVKTRISVGKQKTSFYLTDLDYYWNVYLKSEHWKELKRRKLSLNPFCEVCGTQNHLDVHHLLYKNLYDVEISDLKTLCRKHHTDEHKNLSENKRKRNHKTPNLKAIRRREHMKYLQQNKREKLHGF